MLIQKTFHVARPLAETREQFQSAGLQLNRGLRVALEKPDRARLELRTPAGFRAEVHLEELPAQNAHQILFQSVDGHLEMGGLLEFFAIRERLTEVQLTLDYSFKMPGCAGLESSLERLIERQLRTLRLWMTDGVSVPRLSRQRRLRTRARTDWFAAALS